MLAVEGCNGKRTSVLRGWNLSGDRGKSFAKLSLRGTITPDDLELLRDHIELAIKALARKVKDQ